MARIYFSSLFWEDIIKKTFGIADEKTNTERQSYYDKRV